MSDEATVQPLAESAPADSSVARPAVSTPEVNDGDHAATTSNGIEPEKREEIPVAAEKTGKVIELNLFVCMANANDHLFIVTRS